MSTTLNYRFQFRHGTAAEWTASNEVLLPDEGGHESDTGKLKIGDGVTPWNSLPYFPAATGGFPFAIGDGTGDAITAAFADLSLLDGVTFGVRAPAGNTISIPTLAINGGSALTVTKLGGVSLTSGDIARAGHELLLRYNAVVSPARFELLNPGSGAGGGGGGSSISQLTVTEASIVLTTGAAKTAWFAPYDCKITDMLVGVITPSTSGSVTLDLKNASGSSLLAALPSVAAGANNSLAAAAAFAGGFAIVSKGDHVSIDCSAAGTNAKGVFVSVYYSVYTPSGTTGPWRYIRLSITANNADSSYTGVGECEMASTAGGANLCTGGTASASSQYNNGSAAAGAAFDGVKTDPGNGWVTLGGAQIPSWLQYDFGAGNSITIAELRLWNQPGQHTRVPLSLVVQGSNDGSSFTDIKTFSGLNAWVDYTPYVLDF